MRGYRLGGVRLSRIVPVRCVRRWWSVFLTVLLAGFLVTLSVVFLQREYINRTPIYIVEHHRDVFSYWIRSANAGLISKTGNVLINVDGHAAERHLPEYFDEMPSFTYPKNDRETAYFTRSNNAFIEGAVISGLISRVIWIWPSWNQRYMHHKSFVEKTTVDLGIYVSSDLRNNLDQQRHPRRHFCRCVSTIPPSKQFPRKCSFTNTTSTHIFPGRTAAAAEQKEEDDELQEVEVEVSSDACATVRSYVSEHVNEFHVKDRMAHDLLWLRGGDVNSSVILDVDEDFFGFENVAVNLAHAGIDVSTIRTIDDNIAALICARSAADESVADVIVRDVIQALLATCPRDSDQTSVGNADEAGIADAGSQVDDDRKWGKNAIRRAPFENALKAVDDAITQSYYKFSSLFCGRSIEDVRESWRRLAATFYKLSASAVHRLLNVGFCFSPALPRQRIYAGDSPDPSESETRMFALCIGARNANQSTLFENAPSAHESEWRLRSFANLVSMMTTVRPGIVTVSRSVRDGYTPRVLAADIEENILTAALKSGSDEWQQPQLLRYELHYDVDLLGGDDGWQSRPFIAVSEQAKSLQS